MVKINRLLAVPITLWIYLNLFFEHSTMCFGSHCQCLGWNLENNSLSLKFFSTDPKGLILQTTIQSCLEVFVSIVRKYEGMSMSVRRTWMGSHWYNLPLYVMQQRFLKIHGKRNIKYPDNLNENQGIRTWLSFFSYYTKSTVPVIRLWNFRPSLLWIL